MKRTIIAATLLISTLLVPTMAQAKFVEIWGSGLAGYGGGTSSSDKDFYKWVKGGAAGVEVGAKILFLGAFIDYLRWFGGTADANLISFNLGSDSTFEILDGLDIVLRLAGAAYLGTLPDDAKIMQDGVPVTQVNTRGIGAHGGIGLRKTFAKIFSIGVTPEIGYHYFFGGAKTSVTDDNSSGLDYTILAYLRMGLGF